jgi:hypothetical protein
MSNTEALAALAGLALLGLIAVWNSGRKSVRKAHIGVREVTRRDSTAGRALGTAVVIVGIQWAVVATVADPTATAVVLGVPALFAGASVARLFAVREVAPASKGGRR